jgi:hypothetical protein
MERGIEQRSMSKKVEPDESTDLLLACQMIDRQEHCFPVWVQ